ncbi:MAG: prepilin-type N-terminal cleavage/methylation domain-containing protein [Planctomycetota bacterium]
MRLARSQGFTLVEMLLVIALIAMVLGIGLGALSRLDLGDRVAVALVQDSLRSAQNYAVGRAAPARVRLDVQTGAIRSEGMQVVGTWHFEDLPLRGAFELEGALLGGRLVDDGFQGRALSFVGEPSRSKVEIPVQGDPAWNLRDGFALRVALRPHSGGAAHAGGAVLALGESAGLETTNQGAVRAWIAAEVADERGDLRRGGKIPVETLPRTLVDDRWSVVEVQYDRRSLRLWIDGVLAASVAEIAPVWKLDGPLVISPTSVPWPGTVDSLVVSCVTARDESRLPGGVAFAAGTPAEVLFAPGGGLDRDMHREPVRIALDFEDGRKASVLVNAYGTVE